MVSEDFLTGAAWTALLEQPPCSVRGCRAWFPKGGTWNQLAPVLRDFGWTSFALGSNKHQSKHRGISLWTWGFHLHKLGNFFNISNKAAMLTLLTRFWKQPKRSGRFDPEAGIEHGGFPVGQGPGSGSDYVPNLEWWSCEVEGSSIFVGAIFLGNRSATSTSPWGWGNHLRLYPLGVALYVSWIHGEFVRFFPEKKKHNGPFTLW